jgi:hypothetical protein
MHCRTLKAWFTGLTSIRQSRFEASQMILKMAMASSLQPFSTGSRSHTAPGHV